MYSMGALLFHMHFPDHPTGPLPVGDGNVSGCGFGGVPLTLPRATDLATTSLLKALLAADPAKRPTAPDALQVEMSPPLEGVSKGMSVEHVSPSIPLLTIVKRLNWKKKHLVDF